MKKYRFWGNICDKIGKNRKYKDTKKNTKHS